MRAARYLKALTPLALSAALVFARGAGAQTEVAAATAALASSLDSAAAELRAALQRLAAQDARVAAVAYRLAVANVQLCREAEPEPGIVIQSVF